MKRSYGPTGDQYNPKNCEKCEVEVLSRNSFENARPVDGGPPKAKGQHHRETAGLMAAAEAMAWR